MSSKEDVGRALTALRLAAGMSIREVSRQLDVPSATLGGYFSGRHLPPLTQNQLLRRLLSALGVTDPAQQDAWARTVARVRRGRGEADATATIAADDEGDGSGDAEPSSYPGLRPLDVGDARWFAGRWELLAQLRQMVQQVRDDPRLPAVIAVVGASGAGKSSLVRAGLLGGARLSLTGEDEQISARLAAPEGVVVRPSTHSVDALAAEAATVVVIDQFEEVFALPAGECSTWLERLQQLATAPVGQRVVVVLAVRADFYGQLSTEPFLAAAVQRAQLLVTPMTEPELRDAVVTAIRESGVAADPSFIEAVLRDVAGAERPGRANHAGVLPMLAHALGEALRSMRSQPLTAQDYRRSGGIAHAVAQTAEHVYGQLSPRDRAVAPSVFLLLVDVDSAGGWRRHCLPITELASFPDAGQMASVVAAYTSARLLTIDEESVEIAHEALLSAWPRLHGWLQDGRADLGRYRQLAAAAAEWEAGGRTDDELLRGGRLAAAREFVDTRTDTERERLPANVRAYVVASTAAAETAARRARRRTRRLQQLVAVVSALVVVAAGLAVYAWRARSAATQARDVAQSTSVALAAQQLRTSDPGLAAQLAVAAYRISPTTAARSALLDATATPHVTRWLTSQQPMQAAVPTPDGRVLATAGGDGALRLFDLESSSSQPLGQLSVSKQSLFGLAIRPDGRVLATAGDGGILVLVDISNPRAPRRLATVPTGGDHKISGLAWSADGSSLFAAVGRPDVRRWRVAADGTSATELPTLGDGISGTLAVAVSSDGHFAAAAGVGGTAEIFDLRSTTTAPVAVIPGQSNTAYALAFAPDNVTLAVGYSTNYAQLFRLDTAGQPTPAGAPIAGFNSWVTGLQFSSDGTRLALSSSDNTSRIVNVASEATLVTLPHPAPVTSVAFVPHSRDLLTAAGDGTARRWQLPAPVLSGPAGSVFTTTFGRGLFAAAYNSVHGGVQLWSISRSASGAELPRRRGFVGVADQSALGSPTGTAAISPNGRTLAMGTRSGAVVLADISDPDHPVVAPVPLTGPTALIESLAFSPHGDRLAAASDDGTIRIWSVPSATHTPTTTLSGVTGLIFSVAWSPDGRWVAGAASDRTARLWNLDSPATANRPVTLRGFGNYVYGVAFSANGQLLAAGSADHTVRLFGLADPAKPKLLGGPLTGPSNYVEAVSFSSDSRLLAAASLDRTTTVWDISTPTSPQLFARLSVATDPQFATNFAPTGSLLAAGGADRLSHLWITDPSVAQQRICTRAGAPITRAEWTQSVPGRPYDPPCA